MSKQEPIGERPADQTSEKALRSECLETVCTDPENGNEQCQLWEEQTARPDKQERVE
jgi:hypothetical protein